MCRLPSIHHAEMCGTFIWCCICVPLRRRMNGINHACLVLIYFHVLAMVWFWARERKSYLINSHCNVTCRLIKIRRPMEKTKANISLFSKAHHLECDIILRSHYANKDIAALIAWTHLYATSVLLSEILYLTNPNSCNVTFTEVEKTF